MREVNCVRVSVSVCQIEENERTNDRLGIINLIHADVISHWIVINGSRQMVSSTR